MSPVSEVAKAGPACLSNHFLRTARTEHEGVEITMRTSQTFLSRATVAALALLAATSARATDTVAPPPPPIQCTTNGVTFKVVNGPNFVSCTGVTGGQCTELEYELSSPQTTVYALQGRGVKAVTAAGASITVANACVGIDGLGKGSCHEQAIKMVKATLPKISNFKITLAGLRVPTRTSVGLNPSYPTTKVCEILGIGLEGGPNTNQATQNNEEINFKGCRVAFTRDPVTRAVMVAQLTADSPPNCTGPFMSGNIILPRPVAELELKEPGPLGKSYGKGRFADGFSFSSGKGSCTTYVIGGVVYTWGTEPCPCEDPDPECQ